MKIEIYFDNMQELPSVLESVKQQVNCGNTSGNAPEWFVKANPAAESVVTLKGDIVKLEYDDTKEKFYLIEYGNAVTKTFYGDYALKEYLRSNRDFTESKIENLINEAINAATN